MQSIVTAGGACKSYVRQMSYECISMPDVCWNLVLLWGSLGWECSGVRCAVDGGSQEVVNSGLGAVGYGYWSEDGRVGIWSFRSGGGYLGMLWR